MDNQREMKSVQDPIRRVSFVNIRVPCERMLKRTREERPDWNQRMVNEIFEEYTNRTFMQRRVVRITVIIPVCLESCDAK
jgi:hypothetical protein